MKIIDILRGKEDECKKNQKELYNFLIGKASNYNGATIDSMRNCTYDELEMSHNYIQWLFPTLAAGNVNPNTPAILDRNLCKDEKLQKSIRESFDRILCFYGFIWDNDKIIPSDDHKSRTKEWVRPGNHNYWRITHIIECLRLFNLDNEAECFVEALTQLYQNNPDNIGEKTFSYWIRANAIQN